MRGVVNEGFYCTTTTTAQKCFFYLYVGGAMVGGAALVATRNLRETYCKEAIYIGPLS